MRRTNFGVSVDARGNLIEANFPLRGDADVDEGDDTLIAQAVPIDDRLVAADHALPLELTDQLDDLILSDAGQRGDARRVAASVGDERRQHATYSRIPAVRRRASRSSPLGLKSVKRFPSHPCKQCGMGVYGVSDRLTVLPSCRLSPVPHGGQEQLAQVLGSGGTRGELGHPVLWQRPGDECIDVMRPRPTPESPFGIPTRRINRSIWLARISPASSAAAPPVSAPSSRAACK